MRYGRLVDGRIEYAPATLVAGGTPTANPTREQYLAAGWKPVLGGGGAPKPPRAGFRWARDGWTEQAAGIVPRWRLAREEKPAPRTFSKLRCVAALMEAGVWGQVKEWIEANGLWDLYLAAQEFAEDDTRFTQGRAALQAALGWTDAQVEEVLGKSAKEGA